VKSIAICEGQIEHLIEGLEIATDTLIYCAKILATALPSGGVIETLRKYGAAKAVGGFGHTTLNSPK
jgi:hypothetical protein